MSMILQAAGVKKALAVVSKICKVRDLVQFGEEPEDCYIQDKTTGTKVMLEKEARLVRHQGGARVPGEGHRWPDGVEEDGG